MAICPKCSGTIGMTVTVCPFCGYDFPQSPDTKPDQGRGWEYSGFADFSLLVGAGCSLLFSMITACYSVVAIFKGQVMNGGMGLLQAITMYALFVVFLRVKNS